MTAPTPAPPARHCPTCGRPLPFSTMFLCGPAGGTRVAVPGNCPVPECEAARVKRDQDHQEAVIADAIARGVIAP